MSRRHSVVDAYAGVENKIRETMTNLSKLWDEISMPDSMRLKRVDSAFTNIIELCDDMHNGEIDMVANVKRGVKENMANVNKMRLELEMPSFEKPANVNDNSVGLLRALQAEVKNLEEEFNNRHEQQKQLLERIEALKKRLDSDFELEHDTHVLFPRAAHEQYEEATRQMEETLLERYKKMEEYQSDLKQWRKIVTTVESFIAGDPVLQEFLCKSVDSDDFVFSDRNVELLEKYHSEMKPVYLSWLEEMEYNWTEQYEVLSTLWNKCHVAIEDQHYPQHFEPGRHTVETLARMNEERQRLEEKYEGCKVIYEMVDKWMDAWNEKLSIERKRKEPDYYKKSHVLPDNKRERELIAIMERLEQKVRVAVQKYSHENGENLIIHGVSPPEYIENIKEEHKQELKYELQLKKEEKTRIQSPQPTPKSQKRPNPFFRTPRSAAPAVKRLNFEAGLSPCPSPMGSDGISFIGPVKRQPNGPKTSSPKDGPILPTMGKRAMTPSSTASSSNMKRTPMTRRN